VTLKKVTDGVEECRHLGVIVSPPDINKSRNGFELEDNKDSLGGIAIRFGFGGIKNVGDAAIDAILRERDANGPFASFNDFCLRVDSKVNKKVLECLIKVGAFDQFGERNALLSSVDKCRSDCEKIRSKHSGGQFGLFDAPTDKEARPVAPPDVFPEVEPMGEKEKLAMEKELLGIYVSENPIAKMLSNFQILALPKLKSFLEKEANTPVKTSAVITKVKVIATKKDGSKMAFVGIEDDSGKMEMIVFPKAFKEYESLIVENNAVYIEGKVNQRDQDISIVADIISLTPPENAAKYDFIVNVPNGTSQTQLMKLNQLLKTHPNGHRGLIILPNGKNVPLSYGVHYTPDLQSEINQILNIN
jgi:DNA polymerase III subunit alpha